MVISGGWGENPKLSANRCLSLSYTARNDGAKYAPTITTIYKIIYKIIKFKTFPVSPGPSYSDLENQIVWMTRSWKRPPLFPLRMDLPWPSSIVRVLSTARHRDDFFRSRYLHGTITQANILHTLKKFVHQPAGSEVEHIKKVFLFIDNQRLTTHQRYTPNHSSNLQTASNLQAILALRQ